MVQRTIVVPVIDLPSNPAPQSHRALVQAVSVSHLYCLFSSSLILEFLCVIQLVSTIVFVAISKSGSAVIVIGEIFNALVNALHNLVMKSKKSPPSVTSQPAMDAIYMPNDSSNIAIGKEKK